VDQLVLKPVLVPLVTGMMMELPMVLLLVVD
jgi:hypothetical protein